MATATLTFDLNDPDDKREHLRCVKSEGMAIALWDIVYNVGKDLNNHYDNINDEEYDKLRPIDGIILFREKIADILEENGIKIDELIV